MLNMIIDTDTASDDAVALMMALNHPDVDIKAITVVAGNVPVEKGVQNALFITETCGKNVPVYQGMDKPLSGKLHTAEHIHGKDGMGDIGLPLHGRNPSPGHAVDRLIETINQHENDLTIVALGPLTNLAMAILKEPAIAKKVNRCFIMGGTSDGYGNVTSVAEYNFFVDPEATNCVLTSGMPITLIGWDISRKYATFGDKEVERLLSLNSPLAKLCCDIQRVLNTHAVKHNGLKGFDLPDPIAMAIAIHPEICQKQGDFYAIVETGGKYTRGQLIVDDRNMLGKSPNVNIVLEASKEEFRKLLFDTLEK